jgi:hypothetical protein
MSAAKEEGRAETEAKLQTERQADEMKRQTDRIAKARKLKQRGVDYEIIMIATELSLDETKRLE